MESTKDEFNIPNIIIDPRTHTQYSKGKFLGKVCRIILYRSTLLISFYY